MYSSCEIERANESPDKHCPMQIHKIITIDLLAENLLMCTYTFVANALDN